MQAYVDTYVIAKQEDRAMVANGSSEHGHISASNGLTQVRWFQQYNAHCRSNG